MFTFFLSSGIFLGWSLGANDASNAFGTAVGSRMIKFRTAVIYCSLFIILGAVNALAGAFVVAFATAISVYLMTLAKFPVSTSQAIVGAVIGMGLLKGGRGIKWKTVGGIASGWVTTPIIAALVSFISFFLCRTFLCRIHTNQFNTK